MKKSFIFIALFSMSALSQAQMHVNYVGETTFQKSLFTKNIYSSVSDTTTSTGTNTVITGWISNSKYKATVGVSGYAATKIGYNPSILPYAIGVKGQATQASGMNFGVFGIVVPPSGGINNPTNYMNYGAGVYGTKKNTIKILSTTYAGYFDGDLGVSGGITSNGTISGVFVCQSPNLSSTSSLMDTEKVSENISRNLASLKLGTFYLEQPKDERISFQSTDISKMNASSLDATNDQKDITEMQVLSRKH